MPAQAKSASPQMQAAQANQAIRQMLLRTAVERWVPLPAIAPSAAQLAGTAPIIVTPNPAGLLKKFVIEIAGTANNTDGVNAATLSDIGLANLIQQIAFQDTQAVIHKQTTGWHLDLLFRAKHRTGAVRSLLSTGIIDSGLGFGNTFPVVTAPTGFAHATSQPFRMVFELPCCYSDEDLRGASWLGVVNAPAQLSITLTPTPFAAAGVDSTLACWKGAAGNISAVTIQIYQVYLDQVPMRNGVPVLPPIDLATMYELKNTTNAQPFQANQDNPLSYSNFRRFLSTFLIYNHDPSADAGRAGGTDINRFILQLANSVNLWTKFPLQVARQTRVLTLTDFPLGCYYFSTRKPSEQINTLAYGNTQLILNPITAAAGAYSLVGWEDFADINAVKQAGSLAG